MHMGFNGVKKANLLAKFRYGALNLAFFVCIGFILTFSMSSLFGNAYAVGKDLSIGENVIKVGWYYSPKFQEGSSEQDIKSGYSYEYLQKISAYNGWEYEYVYGKQSELLERIKNGEIDIMAGIPITEEFKKYLIFPEYDMGTFFEGDSEETIYLAVNHNKKNLLDDLNSALHIMNEMEPFFLQNLKYTYYASDLSQTTLSDLEKEWVNSHDTLVIGYMDEYLPYSGTDSEGMATGLFTDVVTEALMELKISDKLKVEYVKFSSYDEMISGLHSGQLDAAFPVGGGSWNIDKDDIIATTAVVTAGMNLVYKGSYYREQGGSFAINMNNKLQYYFVMDNFPDATIVECTGIEDCIDAVSDGRAEFTVINGLRANLVRDNSRYSNLSMVQLQESDSRSFGVQHGNTALMVLLNRGINLIGADYGTNASYKYVNVNGEFSLSDYVRDNMGQVMILVAIMGSLIILVMSLYLRGIKKAQKETQSQLDKNKELTRQLEINNRELEASRDAANAANHAKSVFLFNMSHDIRTPMNAIIGFTQLLKKSSEDSQKVLDYTGKIESSSQFLLSLINDVLEMSRIESGNTELDEVPWSTEQFNDALFSVFDEQMRKKNITFTRSFDVEHQYVYCDTIKLRQVFLNILSNSFKYTPEGGKVTMALKELETDKEGYAKFQTTISDTGIGMSKDFLPHLFEEFSREKNVTESKVEGTGLGMPIVKKLVELMDGSISVESEPGKGTTFVVIVYHRIADEKLLTSSETVEASDKNFEGKRILLAEDNELNAEIGIDILTDLGFEVERAEDGIICVDMLSKASKGYYDLILMDIQMPNMNGYEATRNIRAMEDESKANIPIVAMTANAFEEDRINAFKAGMNGHLSKPIEIKKLMNVLTDIVNGKQNVFETDYSKDCISN